MPVPEFPVPNSDPELHNIHAYEPIGRARRTIFNYSQIPGVDQSTL